jgi:hypothetical protein
MEDLQRDSMDDALRLMADVSASGKLVVTGDRCGGALYLCRGEITFGVVDGAEPLTARDIRPEVWLEALARPEADRDLGCALVAAGANPESVRRLARRSITRALRHLRTNTTGTLAVTAGSHPFGTGFRFPVEEWTTPQADDPTTGYDAGTGPDTVIVTVEGDHLTITGDATGDAVVDRRIA